MENEPIKFTPDTLGVFVDKKDTARVSSLAVAEMFEKQHFHVMRDIEMLDCSKEFNQSNFGLVKYTDSKGETRPAYNMTRDGFVFLAMGYRGKKAAQFKEAYIRRFNEMESYIKTLVATRTDYPQLTEHISILHERPKAYHYSNEADMLNRLVFGMTAKQFREKNGLEKGESLRPHLNDEQIWLMNLLQKVDIGLMIAVPDFEARKRQLEWYKAKMLETRQLEIA